MKIATIALALSFMTTAFAQSNANCVDAYQDAGFNREVRNTALVVAGVVVITVAAIILSEADDDYPGTGSSTAGGRRNTYYSGHVHGHTHYNYYSNHGYYSHNRYGHRYYQNHYHYNYGYYYVGSNSEDRWTGDNAFDKVLKAYNDSKVWANAGTKDSTSYVLAKLNKKIARRIKRIAKREGKLHLVEDITASRMLTTDADKLIVRDTLLESMENQTFCNRGRNQNKAMKRTKVINELARAVIDSRE